MENLSSSHLVTFRQTSQSHTKRVRLEMPSSAAPTLFSPILCSLAAVAGGHLRPGITLTFWLSFQAERFRLNSRFPAWLAGS